jgi:hypothetical protein
VLSHFTACPDPHAASDCCPMQGHAREGDVVIAVSLMYMCFNRKDIHVDHCSVEFPIIIIINYPNSLIDNGNEDTYPASVRFLVIFAKALYLYNSRY